MAKVLRSLGINWNLAPVADVSNNSNSFIYDRTLGQNYKLTAQYVSKVVPAIQKQQVAATLKHFPGYAHLEIFIQALQVMNVVQQKLRKMIFCHLKLE